MNENEMMSAFSHHYEAGTIIFEEGEPGSRMYIIRSGKVRIYKKIGEREVVLAVLENGDFFGEMAILEKLPRSATAKIESNAELIELDAETFEHSVRNNSEIAMRIMRKLASRVRELDLRVQRLLVDSGIGRTVELLRWLLPKGHLDGAYYRFAAATVHVHIATQAGVTPGQVEIILERLKASKIVKEDGSDILVANDKLLEQFSSYLDLKNKYEEPVGDQDDAGARHKGDTMARLLKVLQIEPEELKESQSTLARQYHRYMELRNKFADYS